MEKTSTKGEDSNTTPTDDNISLNEVKKCKTFFLVCLCFLFYFLFNFIALSLYFSFTTLSIASLSLRFFWYSLDGVCFCCLPKDFGTKLWHQNGTHINKLERNHLIATMHEKTHIKREKKYF